MTVVPVGYSLVTHTIAMPAPSGMRAASCSYGVVNSPDPSDCQALHTSYAELIHKPLGSTECFLSKTTMRDETFAFEANNVVAGENTNTLGTPNVSLVVAKRTGQLGRKNQGRFYPPGVVYEQTFDSSGTMTSGSLEDYQEAFDEWFDNNIALSYGMVILHADETGPTVVTSLVVDRVASTQRRRLR